MAKFTFNNIKNISTRYIFFKINYRYYLYILYKNNINLYSTFILINKLVVKLKNHITIYIKDF